MNDPSRPAPLTIGLLIESLAGPYQSGIWPGISNAARAHGVNLIAYCGGALQVSPRNRWEYQRNTIFHQALADACDGYVISCSLGSYIGHQDFIDFFSAFLQRPVVGMSTSSDAIPTICVDNRTAMAQLMRHLLVDHGYRRFAFISGPQGNSEAEERREVFEQELAAHGITPQARHMIEGEFSVESGVAAIEQLYAGECDAQVIVAADDETALGALKALEARGLKVPDDVALVGFDDIMQSGCSEPSLTTVEQPIHELGMRAVELLLDRIAGRPVPMTTRLDGRLRIRQSCGCYLRAQPLPATTGDPASQDTFDFDVRSVDPLLRNDMDKILGAFQADWRQGTDRQFARLVAHSVNGPGQTGDDAEAAWHDFFGALETRFRRDDSPGNTHALALVSQARRMLENARMRQLGRMRIETVVQHQDVHTVGRLLANSPDLELLFATMARELPGLGIETFFVVLHNQIDATVQDAALRLACVKGIRISRAAQKTVRSPKALVQAFMKTELRAAIVAVEPLYFQDQLYGSIVFGLPAIEPELYEVLAQYISSALHMAFLLQKVGHQAYVLAQANRELESLRAREHAYLEAIQGELELGRKIQMGILPQSIPRIPGWSAAAAFMPARAVSGDLYDTFMLGDSTLAVVIADVSGKDVSAGLFMSLIITLVRVLSERAHADGDDPLAMVDVINEYIFTHYSSGARPMYVTIFFGLLDVKNAVLRYVNAGHPAPLLVQQGAVCASLASTGPAVGLNPQGVFKAHEVNIQPGTTLCAVTDGVMDARNAGHEFFTAQRLRNVIIGGRFDAAASVVAAIQQSLRDHVGDAPPNDDITILVVRRDDS